MAFKAQAWSWMVRGCRPVMAWSALVGCVVFGLMMWADRQPARWESLGVNPLPMPYADMVALLASGQLHADGGDHYQIPNMLDPYGRPHVYGPGWLVSGRLGLTVVDSYWMGTCLVLVFLAGVIRLFKPTNWRSSALMMMLLMSSPVLLGLSRANNDLFIVLMCLAAAWLAGRSEPVARLAMLVLVGAAALLKYYPLALIPALLVLPGNVNRQVARIGLLLAVVVAAVALQWRDYLTALKLVPNSESIFNYHAFRALKLLGVIFGQMPVRAWGGAIVALVLALLWIWRGRSGWWTFLPTTGAWGFLTCGAAAVWAGCLLVGPSYSYRAIWLLPLAAWAWHRREDMKKLTQAFLGILITFLWAWWPKYRVAHLFENDSNRWGEALMNTVGFEQVFVLTSLVVCLWMLTGWAWRRSRELIDGAKSRPPLAAG